LMRGRVSTVWHRSGVPCGTGRKEWKLPTCCTCVHICTKNHLPTPSPPPPCHPCPPFTPQPPCQAFSQTNFRQKWDARGGRGGGGGGGGVVWRNLGFNTGWWGLDEGAGEYYVTQVWKESRPATSSPRPACPFHQPPLFAYHPHPYPPGCRALVPNQLKSQAVHTNSGAEGGGQTGSTSELLH